MKKFRLLTRIAALIPALALISCDPATPVPPADDPDENITVTPKPDNPPVEEPEQPPVEEPETDRFKLKVYDVTSVTATVEVEPVDATARYYTDIISEANFLEASEHGFNDYMSYILEKLETQTGKSRAEVVDMISSYGNDGFILTNLIPESNYYAFAVGIDEKGMTTTELVHQAFTTLSSEVSANSLTVSLGPVEGNHAIINVESSNNDPYICTIEPVTVLEGLSDEGIAEYIIQNNIAWGGLEQITYTGRQQIEYEGKSGWDYEVIAFGYANGAVTTEVTRMPFRTMDGGDPSACAFGFGFEFNTWDMHLSISPSDESVVFICNYIKKSDLDVLAETTGSIEGGLAECLENLIEDMIADCGTRARVIDLITMMGDQGFDVRYENGTEYIQWAVPVDQEGNPTASFSMSEVFTSPEEVLSDASLTLKSYKLYDGTELAQHYPEFKSAKNYAVVELIVEPSPEAENWWSYIALEDLSDRSREVIIKNLLQAPTTPKATKQYVICYWGVNTIIGVAEDSEGLYGPLLMKVVDLKKEEAAPASDLMF